MTWGTSQELVWGATLTVAVVSKTKAGHRSKFVLTWESASARSSPGLCISQTRLHQAPTPAGRNSTGGCVWPLYCTGPEKVFQCHWQVQLPVLLCWARSRPGRELDTLHWREAGHNSRKRRMMSRRWPAVQRTGAPGRQGQVVIGSVRISPQVAIMTMGLVSVFSNEPPHSMATLGQLNLWLPFFFFLFDWQFRVSLAIFLKS